MALDLQKTCWRGVELSHPSDWEASRLSGPGEPFRLTLSDRAYERLDIRTNPMKRAPDLNILLEKFRQRVEDETKLQELHASPWHGVIHKTPTGSVIHALQYIEERGILAELTMIWPQRPDEELQRAILGSVTFPDNQASQRLWQSMGVIATVPLPYDLTEPSYRVGRISWKFETERRHSPVFTVERLALPDYWLKTTLADWLAAQAPAGSTVLRQGPTRYNDHPAEQLQTRTRFRGLGVLRGFRQLRTDLAWKCPKENRVYHASYSEPSREEEIEIPKAFHVRCCQDAPPIRRTDTQFQPPAAKPDPKRINAPAMLQARPYQNQTIGLERTDGGGMILSTTLKRPRLLVPPISWLLPFHSTRRSSLDPLGAEVLDMCDGKSTVERMIERFALAHKLSFREGQLSILEFLRQLTQRGLVAIVGPQLDTRKP